MGGNRARPWAAAMWGGCAPQPRYVWSVLAMCDSLGCWCAAKGGSGARPWDVAMGCGGARPWAAPVGGHRLTQCGKAHVRQPCGSGRECAEAVAGGHGLRLCRGGP